MLRDPKEFSHSRSVNSLVLGKSYERDQGDLSCRQLISGGRDGKIRLWEAQHMNDKSQADASAQTILKPAMQMDEHSDWVN